MGIERTDQWLKEDFRDPIKICERLLKYFHQEEDPSNIYNYLLKFGMYKPNRASWNIYNQLAEQNTWEKIDNIFKKYKKLWNGPEIPIFIFPLMPSGAFLRQERNMKSGVSFKDKLFLFLSPLDDEKESEAVFVHEYHHVCRMNKQSKHFNKYTLLDSIILEGLAEHAVENYCGEAYRAKWCEYFSEKELFDYWDKFLMENINIKKSDPVHDQLLYGNRDIPNLLGYTAGYHIVKIFKRKKNFSTKASFSLQSTDFLKILDSK